MELNSYIDLKLSNLSKEVENSLPIQTLRSVEQLTEKLLNEIRTVTEMTDTTIYFGKTLQNFKFILCDNKLRRHEFIIQYADLKFKILVSPLPHSSNLNISFETIHELINTLISYLDSLENYLYQLDLIDLSCTVVEPQKPSYKDEYRRIYLDRNAWLHVEIRPDGSATNLHIIGQSELWHKRLRKGLELWDHNENIIDNILMTCGLKDFPIPSQCQTTLERNGNVEAVCNICLCYELPNISGVPQPLCPNDNCGAYYHRNCLFEWFKVSAGRQHALVGVIYRCCPTCHKTIACHEADT